MKPKTFMIIAGEASGDLRASELVTSLREELATVSAGPTGDYQPLHASLEPRFFGAGGARMAAAGVELAFDMTRYSVIGLSDVLKNYFVFRGFFNRLVRLALERRPDAVICVDFAGFNRRFAHAIRARTRSRRNWFHNWKPRIIQYVSPQVWASRPGRAHQMARDYDLLLSIFPFEKGWYAKRVSKLRVEFVGHPMIGRGICPKSETRNPKAAGECAETPRVILLPGSRAKELSRHLPVMLGALESMRRTISGLRAEMVLPNETLLLQAKDWGLPEGLEACVGDLEAALTRADVAIASTGTVTMECALFGVPTVAMYKTSWSTYQIGKRIVTVRHLAMPNLLANEEIFPEFIQGAATPENIARAALGLLRDEERKSRMRIRLKEIMASLGQPGASRRAARAIIQAL